MRILHVITGLGKAAGTSTFVENIVREQRALGHDVEVLTNDNAHQLTTNNYQLTTIFHIHGLWSPLLHKAARFARKNKIPVVWSAHGMTAPWSLHHKWWKKCLPWYLYQLPDLRSSALIHCTTDLEADWNRSLGFTNVFVVPLGTTLPTGRGGCPQPPAIDGVSGRACGLSRAAIDATTNDALARDFDRRDMAEKKVAEWLDGVNAATFEAALQKLIEEKAVRGEYKFKRPEERESALEGARRFYRDFSRKIIPLSDGRYVYFAPDQRSKERNASNAISWAEYAFHAVSSSGKLLDGKNFRERIYNATKVADLPVLESVIRSEQCMYRLIDAYPENDAVIFVGHDAESGRLEVVTRLDQFGNAEANLGEVTVIAKHKRKETPPPKFRPLTEVVEAVAKHQAAGFSPSTTKNSIANPPSPRKGGNVNSSLQLQLETTTKFDNTTVQPSTSNLQPRTLLYVGRIYPVKALDNAIRAVALMKQPIILRLVGPDQSNHKAELISLCESLGVPYTDSLAERSRVDGNEVAERRHTSSAKTSACAEGTCVQFIGPKYDADLSAEYDACDALILVSHTENFGATVIDALAHSKPVITSTNTPWKVVLGENTNNQQLTTNNSASGRCGWWVDNSPESLARTFTQMLDCTDAQLRAMGANGLALVQAAYTWPAIAQNLISHYSKLTPNS